jgi:hypothetical protein
MSTFIWNFFYFINIKQITVMVVSLNTWVIEYYSVFSLCL